jgi:pyruvate carboxylase subunit B
MNDKKELVDFAILSMKYRTRLTKKFINRTKYLAPNPNEVQSHLPGTILKVNVKEGQQVNEGETILLLEAMKMINEVRMPFTGKVKKINVEAGQQVPKNCVMIELG